jgi:glycosyltransferase involved in cell wall biosynthesis
MNSVNFPLVTVLMTCFNAELTIKESVMSIVNQDFTDWELLLVDNKSDDRSIDQIRFLQDDRIRIVVPPIHLERTAALNFGIKNCRGRYVAILDADDISEPSRLSNQVAMLNVDHELVGVGTFFSVIDQEGKEITRTSFDNDPLAISRQMSHNLLLVHSSMMFRSESCSKVNAYRSEYKYAADFALWLDLLQIGKLGAVPKYLTKIRMSPNSLTHDKTYKRYVITEALRLYVKSQRLVGLRFIDRMLGFKTIVYLSGRYLNLHTQLLLKRLAKVSAR